MSTSRLSRLEPDAGSASLGVSALALVQGTHLPLLSVRVATVTCGQRTLLKIRITSWEYWSCRNVCCGQNGSIAETDAGDRSNTGRYWRDAWHGHPFDPEGCAC